MFKDRIAAADALAQQLEPYRKEQPLVLGIARGAVPMAARIAAALGTQWDVLLAKKLNAPNQPELAVGAVDESGWVYRSDLAKELGIDAAHLEQEKSRQLTRMRRLRADYDAVAKRISPTGRTVIVVDDGLATGATMLAAIHGLRSQGAGKVICAVPIGSKSSLIQASAAADAVVCLQAPPMFEAVSQGYRTFDQVTDEQVLALLKNKAA